MKARWLPRSPVDALFLGLLLWLGSDVDGYLLSMGLGKPLYAYVVLAIFGGGYLLMRGAAFRHLNVLENQWTRRYLLWLVVYGAYGAFTFLESSQSLVAVQSLIYLWEAIVLGGAFSVLMLHPRRLRQAVAALALLALFASVMNVWDFLDPTFSVVPGRAAGFYANPNIAGAFVPLAMLCGFESVSRRWRWPFVVACGMGVLVTFSREAWLMWGAAVFWIGWRANGKRPGRRLFNVALGGMLGVWFLFAVFGGAIAEWVAETPLAHSLDPDTLARLGVGGFSLSDFAAQQRMDAAAYAWHQFTVAPLFGHGIGYVFEWGFPVGPHNMFLRFMAEGGSLGLAVYLGLFWLLWRATAGTARITLLLYFIASFFSHNLLDQPEFILVLTFLLVQAALRYRQTVRAAESPHVGAPA